jgi:carbon-monoxide dehydrogenase medium subunit
LIPAVFAYVRPRSLEEAVAGLEDPDARALAGGQSLIPMMKLRFARPSQLVDIGALDLRGVRTDGDRLRIGALTTHAEIARNVPGALAEAAGSVGDLQVRNMGTLGGSIAHADPACDCAAALLALDGRVRLHGADGERELEARAFFLGPFETALDQRELLVELSVARSERSAYVSVEDPASGYPIAGAAAAVVADGIAVGLTGVGGTPVRLELGSAAEAGDAVAGVKPIGEDAEYHRHLAAVVIRRAAERAQRGTT